ncbi:hypothetical protein [Halobellus rufus]|uniref:hypothetical protein n=1 Tax=Halobellus rufus TaxID=1448860 RepID=UPI0006797D97|nr:hypothetical protein [Halobellus rufus]
MVGDRADGEVVQLVRAWAQVERERDDGLIASVVAGLDHRDDVLLPRDEFGGIGCGVVVARIPARNPREALGELVVATVAENEPELPEGDTIVLVGLGGVVLLGVDPRDDRAGGVFLGEGVGESAHTFGDRDEPHQILLVGPVGVFRGPEDPQLVGEATEDVGILVGDLLGILEALAKPNDALFGVIGHYYRSTSVGNVNLRYGAHPGHFSTVGFVLRAF